MEATNSLLDAAAVGDLVLLDPLTEESLLHTLQERFRRSDIYVGTGPGAGGLGQGGRGGLGWGAAYGVGSTRIWAGSSWLTPTPSCLPADVHWKRGHLGEPLPVPAHLHP